MKTCASCKVEHDQSMFGRMSSRRDGLDYYCKPCRRIRNDAAADKYTAARVRYNRKYKAANQHKTKEWRRRGYHSDVERSRAMNRARYVRNPLRLQSAKSWRARNPEKVNEQSMRRYAAQTHASPSWANRFFMQEIYDLARRRTIATGYEWQVDHIVPLRGRNVCGLHVEHNLRVIPKRANLAKSNRFVVEGC